MSVDCVKRVMASTLILLVSACSTVIRNTEAGDDFVMTEERAALKDAARDLAWSPWPKREGSAFAARFASADADARTTRGEAVDAYLSLMGSEDAARRIAADARRHLVAAAVLADVAERASESPGPRLSDVAVLEEAIADLRETRAVYIAALKKVDADDETVDAIRDPLDAAVKKLSRVADDLADHAMKRRSSNFAGPEAKTASSGAL